MSIALHFSLFIFHFSLSTMLYALCFTLEHFNRNCRYICDVEDHQAIEGIVEIGIKVEAEKAGVLADVLFHQDRKLDVFRLKLVEDAFEIEA